MFRSDAVDLLPEDLDIARLRQQTVTLAELLTEHTPGWEPPRLDGTTVIAQEHCHHHAVLGWGTDQRLLDASGADATRLDSGCCGLAGNFGFEKGHLDISVKCAESVLLPALRGAAPHAVVLADGFSCRTQIHELDSGGREAVHLAELLARPLAQASSGAQPSGDLDPDQRPKPPSLAARTAALIGTTLLTTSTAAALGRVLAGAARARLGRGHHRAP